MKVDSIESNPIISKDNRNNDWQDITVAMLVRNFSCSGGLELYTHKLVEGLLLNGLSITVICEKTDTTLEHEKLRIIEIPKLKTKSGKAEQIKHCFEEFSQSLKKYGPFDIVHSQHIGARPIDIVTFHNHTVKQANKCSKFLEIILNKFKIHFRSDYKLRNSMDSLLFKEASVRIFPSIRCRQDFVEYFAPNEQLDGASLVVAYPGWQLGEKKLSSKSSNIGEEATMPVLNKITDNKEQTIVFVGRGYRKKGLDILLAACSLLKKQNYSFKLLIAGLKEKKLTPWQLRLCGLDKNVHYLGFCQDMEKVYQTGSIIALPSRIEPFGMVVLQAMNYGLVPIVSRTSGVSELLNNEDDSLLIDNHLNKNELAQKLAYLLDNPQELKRLSVAAKEKSQSVIWQSTVETTLHAYRQAFQIKYTG